MSKNNQALSAFLKSTKSASGVYKFGEGKTGLFPVFEAGTAPVSAFAKTVAYWNGEPTDRWVIYCLLVVAQDEESLPDGYEDTIIPISVPKTIAHGMARKLVGDDFSSAASFTELNEEGTLNYGNMFVINRETEGKKTNYTVDIAEKVPADLPATVEVPALSISEYAEADQERAVKRNEEYLEEQAAKGSPKAKTNDALGFL